MRRKRYLCHDYSIQERSLKSKLFIVTVSNGKAHFIQSKFSVTSGSSENPLGKMSLSTRHSQLVIHIILRSSSLSRFCCKLLPASSTKCSLVLLFLVRTIQQESQNKGCGQRGHSLVGIRTLQYWDWALCTLPPDILRSAPAGHTKAKGKGKPLRLWRTKRGNQTCIFKWSFRSLWRSSSTDQNLAFYF